MREEIKKKIWEKYSGYIVKYACQKMKAGLYSDSFIESMRTIYFGGIPASILLLLPSYCLGWCYERSILMAAVLKDNDFHIVSGNILEIRFNPKVMQKVLDLKEQKIEISPLYTNHKWVEVKLNGLWYVIDVTKGIIMLKTIYYLINLPKVATISRKEEVFQHPLFIDILNADIEEDKWASLFLLPQIERCVSESNYKEQLQKEIAFYKESIHYEELVEQDKKEKAERAKLDSMHFKMTNKNAE